MTWKIKVDEERCTGHGRCYVVAPELFVDDEAGYGRVVGEGAVDAEKRVDAERAAAACPEHAIRIAEDR